MLISIQWATATPADWIDYEIASKADIRALPRKPVPVGGEVLDDEPGWVARLCVQGVVFGGYDHISLDIAPALGVLKVAGWQDDPDDFATEECWHTDWQFAIVTDEYGRGQNREVYAQKNAGVPIDQGKRGRAWADRPTYPLNQTLHGIWVPDELWRAHVEALSPRTLDDWR